MYFVTYPNAWIIELIVLIIATGALIYLSYILMKNAIRDGINESKLRHSAPTQPMAPMGYKWALVKIDSEQEDRKAR